MNLIEIASYLCTIYVSLSSLEEKDDILIKKELEALKQSIKILISLEIKNDMNHLKS